MKQGDALLPLLITFTLDLGKSKKINGDYNLMELISYKLMLTMLIY
jgi:hypothetical protein